MYCLGEVASFIFRFISIVCTLAVVLSHLALDFDGPSSFRALLLSAVGFLVTFEIQTACIDYTIVRFDMSED